MTITIPNIDQKLRQAIRVAAARAGLSTAAWVRMILSQAAQEHHAHTSR